MKLNNKGFAISTIMYIILIMAVIIITLTLSLLSNRKIVLDRIKEEVKSDIYFVCIGVTESTKTTGKVPQGNYLSGDEYICEVKPGVRYRFFVLSTESNKVNLLMERNIAADGTEATIENPGGVAWYEENDNTQGPVTAFNFLHEATKDWSNIENIKMHYLDEGGQYESIITTGNITQIKAKNGNITAEYENLKVRIPTLKEARNVGNFNGTNLWMHNYLFEYTGNNGKSASGCDWGEGKVNLNNKNIFGYWLISSVPYESNTIYGESRRAYDVDLGGYINFSDGVYRDESEIYDYANGVRPVISVSKNKLG